MKITLLVSALVGLSVAQYGGLPSCAVKCAQDLVPTAACGSNPECICTYPGFIDQISCCVFKACPEKADQDAALKTAQTICTGTSASLPAAAGCSGAAASGSSSVSGSASATSAAPAATTTHNSGIKMVVNGVGLAGVVIGAAVLL